MVFFFFSPLTVAQTKTDKPLNNFQSSSNVAASFGSRSLECLS